MRIDDFEMRMDVDLDESWDGRLVLDYEFVYWLGWIVGCFDVGFGVDYL